MTQTKKLIEFCKDLVEDETLEVTEAAKCQFRQLMFASIGEIQSVERELGPAVAIDERNRVKDVLDPIRDRIFSR